MRTKLAILQKFLYYARKTEKDLQLVMNINIIPTAVFQCLGMIKKQMRSIQNFLKIGCPKKPCNELMQ